MRKSLFGMLVAATLFNPHAYAQTATLPMVNNINGQSVGTNGVVAVDSQGHDATDTANNAWRFSCVSGCAGGTATTVAPTYSNNATGQPLSLDLSGNLRTLASQNGTWNVGLTGTLPAFAATPTFNIGTAPSLTVSTVTSMTSGNLGTPTSQADVASAALTTTTTSSTFTPTFGLSYEVISR